MVRASCKRDSKEACERVPCEPGVVLAFVTETMAFV